ncbi:MAG: hypothetical protein LBR05_01535 [Azoarcus sp.]|nr:hypothetical protein [Azoarcus sp.]
MDLPRTAHTFVCRDEAERPVVLYSHARLDEFDLILALYLLSIFTTEARRTERFNVDEICAYMTEVMTGMTDMLESLTGNRNLVTESLKALAGSLDGRIETLCVIESLQCLSAVRAIYEPNEQGSRRDCPAVVSCDYSPTTNEVSLTLHEDFLALVVCYFQRTMAGIANLDPAPHAEESAAVL